jgi:hypothetical protein
MTKLTHFCFWAASVVLGSAPGQPAWAQAPTRASALLAQAQSPAGMPRTENSGAGEAAIGNLGKWRLVRTPGTQKGQDVVSMMRTADLLKSDPDFAGVMIRCAAGLRLQVAVVVVRPFPPKARPVVSIGFAKTSANKTAVKMTATVLPGGTALSLPAEAEALARGSWPSQAEVAFTVEGHGDPIRGVLPTDHLNAAIAYLQSNCPAQ